MIFYDNSEGPYRRVAIIDNRGNRNVKGSSYRCSPNAGGNDEHGYQAHNPMGDRENSRSQGPLPENFQNFSPKNQIMFYRILLSILQTTKNRFT